MVLGHDVQTELDAVGHEEVRQSRRSTVALFVFYILIA